MWVRVVDRLQRLVVWKHNALNTQSFFNVSFQKKKNEEIPGAIHLAFYITLHASLHLCLSCQTCL